MGEVTGGLPLTDEEMPLSFFGFLSALSVFSPFPDFSLGPALSLFSTLSFLSPSSLPSEEAALPDLSFVFVLSLGFFEASVLSASCGTDGVGVFFGRSLDSLGSAEGLGTSAAERELPAAPSDEDFSFLSFLSFFSALGDATEASIE
jgi:hypothetical protein